MRYNFLFGLMLLLITGCSSFYYERNVIRDSIGGNPRTVMLDYENRAKQYERSNIVTHVMIYLEIEEPRIISIPEKIMLDKIYTLATIEGTAVYRVELDSDGKIQSHKKVLSAGFGLDEIASEILSRIKIEPAYLAGKSGKSSADITISFRTDGKE